MTYEHPTRQRGRRLSVLCRIALTSLLIPVASGCYTFTPTTLEALPPGQGLRLVVSRQGAAEFASALDSTTTIPTFQGTLEELDNGSVMVRVPLPSDPSTGSTLSLSQVVRVPTSEIVRVDRRDFSLMKTGGLIAGAGVASYLIISQITSLGANDPGEIPPDPEVFFSLLRIPIGE